MKTRPLKVNLRSLADWDRKVLEMVNQGFTVDAIRRHVPLTPSQIAYRYRKAGASPLDYRRGNGNIARGHIARLDRMLGTLAELKKKMRI